MPQPLDENRLRAALIGPYAQVDVVESTGSTNADLREAARAGGRDRTVLVSVTMVSSAGTDRLTGSAVVREDVRQAAIRAALDAVNRRLEPLLP